MNQSVKHHFLPVFYLKGFASENEKFKIFNVKTKKFKQQGKLFSPSSHFYILKDNTITTDFGEDDFMEKLYEKIDNSFAKILYTINNNNYEHRFGINEDDMPYINNFVSQIYWRSPFNKKLQNTYHIFARPKEPPSICSVFPIIFKKNNLIKVYENDYIFDLSQNRIFVKRNLTQRFNHQLHYLINLISLKQSVNDVATSDESYIDFLIKLDNENNCTLEEYKKNLFNELI